MSNIPTFKTPEDKQLFDQLFTEKLAEYRSYFLQTAKELLGYWDADALTSQQLEFLSTVTSTMLYAAQDELKVQRSEYKKDDDIYYSISGLKNVVKEALADYNSKAE